ncbi:MAG: hypothetical protein FWD14_06650 [Treponema sp.]|nr:hypothetical protein [Treponema sp.]
MVRLINWHIIILIFSLFIFSFFACDMKIPDAMEIKGTRSLRLAANVDLGSFMDEILEDMFSEDDNVSLITTNRTLRTHIIRMILPMDPVDLLAIFSNRLSIPPAAVIAALESNGGKTPVDIPIVRKEDQYSDPMVVPNLDFGEALQNFYLTPATAARLYLSGSDVTDALTVNIYLKNDNGDFVQLGPSYKGKYPSNLGVFGEEPVFTGNSLPSGINIPLSFDGKELEIVFDISIPADSNINPLWLADLHVITLEVAVWLPLELIAGNNAIFDFPSMFSEGQDIFFRESNGSESIGNFIEDLNFEIKMNRNLFTGDNYLLLSNVTEGDITPVVVSRNSLNGNSLAFAIDSGGIKKINDTFPFVPRIQVEFEPGARFSLPMRLLLTEVSFSAKINSRFELNGGGGN